MKKYYITPDTRSVEMEGRNNMFTDYISVDTSEEKVTESDQIQSNTLDKTFNWREY